MDIRLEGTYEEMLLKLADYNQEPTATGMARILVRDAAKQLGLWPDLQRVEEHSQPVAETATA